NSITKLPISIPVAPCGSGDERLEVMVMLGPRSRLTAISHAIQVAASLQSPEAGYRRMLRSGLDHAGIEPATECFDDNDGGAHFLCGHADLPADHRRGIIGFLHVIIVYHAHLVRQQMPLLEGAAGDLPITGCESVGEVESEHLLYSPARGRQA